MEQRDIDILTNDMLEAINNSNASAIAKIEMLKNINLFLQEYDKNIKILNIEKMKRNAMFCEDDYDFCK